MIDSPLWDPARSMTAPLRSKLKPEPERDYEAKSRLCLKCRKPFGSSWPGERLCPGCKSEANWREGITPLYEYE